jgi:hypothetical protein
MGDRGDPGAYRKALPILERGAAILEAGPDQLHSARPFQPARNDDIYRLLSAVQMRLGDSGKAVDSALQARDHDPLNPAMYTQLGQALSAADLHERAAVALLTGMLVTSDMGLRQQVIRLYRSGLDPQGCAIVAGPNGPAINPACDLVHRDLCEAAPDAIRIQAETGHQAIAATLKNSFLNEYHCALR